MSRLSKTWLAVLVLTGLLALASGWLVGYLQAAPNRLPLLCHEAQEFEGPIPGKVTLSDQFRKDPQEAEIHNLRFICAPVKTKVLPKGRKPMPVQVGDHFLCYEIDPQAAAPKRKWRFDDQFGAHPAVRIHKGSELCEPADKVVEP